MNLAGNTSAAVNCRVTWNKSIALTQRAKEKSIMNYINKLMVRVRESKKGQTMTEYVLIVAAIAVAGYIAYEGLEGGINTFITNVTATLKAA